MAATAILPFGEKARSLERIGEANPKTRTKETRLLRMEVTRVRQTKDPGGARR